MALTDLKFRATNANVSTLITGLSLNASQMVNRPLTHEEIDSNFLFLAKHSEDMAKSAQPFGSWISSPGIVKSTFFPAPISSPTQTLDSTSGK